MKLHGEGGGPVPASGRWYGQVTDESDDTLEAKAQGF
jgi:hypothetical protein